MVLSTTIIDLRQKAALPHRNNWFATEVSWP
jgi:hypothetical protein